MDDTSTPIPAALPGGRADARPLGGLRLLMGPIGYVDRAAVPGPLPGASPHSFARPQATATNLQIGSGFRWVTELNGHPGHCAEDHWHPTPEEASACFHGELAQEATA